MLKLALFFFAYSALTERGGVGNADVAREQGGTDLRAVKAVLPQLLTNLLLYKPITTVCPVSRAALSSYHFILILLSFRFSILRHLRSVTRLPSIRTSEHTVAAAFPTILPHRLLHHTNGIPAKKRIIPLMQI